MTFLGGISLFVFLFFQLSRIILTRFFFERSSNASKIIIGQNNQPKEISFKIEKKIISISRNFYILLLTKSWIGISQRKSGCQESAVDRGWGRSFRHLDGIWGQLYNWELSCTLAFGGNELMVTRLIGTKSFANTHWSSILKL